MNPHDECRWWPCDCLQRCCRGQKFSTRFKQVQVETVPCPHGFCSRAFRNIEHFRFLFNDFVQGKA